MCELICVSCGCGADRERCVGGKVCGEHAFIFVLRWVVGIG